LVMPLYMTAGWVIAKLMKPAWITVISVIPVLPEALLVTAGSLIARLKIVIYQV